MVLNALSFSGRALYVMPNDVHNKPIELLIGSSLQVEDFNDDTLAAVRMSRRAEKRWRGWCAIISAVDALCCVAGKAFALAGAERTARRGW